MKIPRLGSSLACIRRIALALVFSLTCMLRASDALPPEPADPNPPCPRWSALPKNTLTFTFDTSGLRHAKYAPPQIGATAAQHLTAWRNERLSSRLLLWTTRPLQQVRIALSQLTDAGGRTLPDSAIEPFFVRYVLSDEFGSGCGKRAPGQFKSFLMPDMLAPADSPMDIEANSTRPLWLSIATPPDAVPGDYTATIILHALLDGKPVTRTLTLTLTVLDRTLTPPAQWPFHLDFWQHPSAVARVHNVTPWSPEHFRLLRPLMQRLASAGQKVITATLNKDPWNHQCHDAYGSMILWTKNRDGSFSYDYAVFDKWIRFMMELGVGKQINCYSVIPWNNEIEYRDAAENKTVTVRAVPGTPEFDALWIPFFKNFEQHLRKNKWFGLVRVAMDERDAKSMQATVDFFEKHAPAFALALADNKRAYVKFPNLADMSVSYQKPIEQDYLSKRKQAGHITTYYIYCRTELPNTFTYSPPDEAAFLAWHAIANNYDGVLRWSYNSWTESPLTDSRFRTWPGGDTYIVYPGNLSSVRFEALLEGLQDVEKYRLLKNEYQKNPAPENQVRMQLLEHLLQPFAPLLAPETNTSQLIRQTRATLNTLSKRN